MRTSAKLITTLLAASLVVGCGSDSSYDPNAKPAQANAEGTALVTEFSEDLKNRDKAKLDDLLAPSFQLQRGFGPPVTKAQFLAKLPNLKDYEISNVSALKSGDTITVTFTGMSQLIVGGVELPRSANPLISTFMKIGGKWRMLSHGNFNRPPQTP